MNGSSGDTWTLIRYVFGVACLVTAAVGTLLQIWASRLASKAMPEERSPAAVLEGENQEVYKAWRVGFTQRQRFLTESDSLFALSGLTLYLSVIAALTINFPWLFAWTIGAAIILAVWAGFVAWDLSNKVKAAKAEEREARRAAEAAPLPRVQ